MSTTQSSAAVAHQSFGARLRRAAVGALFSTGLAAGKISQLRRSPGVWFAFRVALGMCGAALVVLPLSFGNHLIFPVLGLALFLVATLLPPAPQEVTDEEIARELGALLIVEGGDYQAGSMLGFPARIYVGPKEVWVLDPYHRTLLAIPAAEISSANTEECEGKWRFRIRWANQEAVFAYDGLFAEQLACIARDAVRGMMQPAVPLKAKARAAGA